ncbi:MAG: chemotaxis protein CheD [Deltaproteobacteria bacterium]|nr:chemotaxis protein CheD [Deltaproteobacteria bacterium]
MNDQLNILLQPGVVRTFVGIAEAKVSDSKADILIASNLGSCLGISVYDPRLQYGGLIHCLLPTAANDPEKAKRQPCMYVDSGLTHLLQYLTTKGSRKNDLIITAAGGATMGERMEHFEIGKKNFTILRKFLWKHNILLKAHDVGGSSPRTVSLIVQTGEVLVKTGKTVTQLA